MAARFVGTWRAGNDPGTVVPGIRGRAMTRLVEAVRALGLDAEIDLDGHWVRLHGERYLVYMVEAAQGSYYTWCDGPGERAIQFYLDPAEAIYAGLGRATGRLE